MKHQLRTLLLLGILTALLIAIGGALGPSWLPVFLVLALVTNVGAYFFSDRLVLRMHGAREVARHEAPGLHAMIEELCLSAGLPKPRICIMPGAEANAFATGRNPQRGVVAFTEGILRLLPERELRGVAAHELAHIRNRDILVTTIAAVIASVITSLGQATQFAAIFGGRSEAEQGSGVSLLGALLAPVAATFLQLAVSRSREYYADEEGARICRDPGALASALCRLHHMADHRGGSDLRPATASMYIVNPFAGQGLAALLSTHPPVEERIRRLEALARQGWFIAA